MAITVIKQPPALILSKQPVSFTVESNATETPLRIKANISGSTDADSVAVDGNGQAEFELSDYLQDQISTRHKTSASPSVYADNPAVVQVEFTELLGSPAVDGDQLVSEALYLLDGAVPKSRRKSLYADYSSLYAYMLDKSPCLTWFPDGESKKVTTSQKEFVNFLQLFDLNSPCDLNMTVVIECDDGSTETMEGVYTVPSVSPMNIVYFPVGHDQLGIYDFLYDINRADDTWKWATAYTVYIYNISLDLVSRYYRFEVDRSYVENRRLLYVRNPFGMLEIVPCTGLGEQTNELKIEVARTNGHVLPEKVSWKFEKTDSVKANTGFLTKAQMQWLSDMDFTEAYELQGDVLHPIVLNDLKLPVLHDGEYQFSAELEYEYAYNETSEEA